MQNVGGVDVVPIDRALAVAERHMRCDHFHVVGQYASNMMSRQFVSCSGGHDRFLQLRIGNGGNLSHLSRCHRLQPYAQRLEILRRANAIKNAKCVPRVLAKRGILDEQSVADHAFHGDFGAAALLRLRGSNAKWEQGGERLAEFIAGAARTHHGHRLRSNTGCSSTQWSGDDVVVGVIELHWICVAGVTHRLHQVLLNLGESHKTSLYRKEDYNQ